jgi:hypothetical protein
MATTPKTLPGTEAWHMLSSDEIDEVFERPREHNAFVYQAKDLIDAFIAKNSPPPAPQREPLTEEPVWIVNSLGELGVKVGERLFFLYKGRNIEYGDPEIHEGSHRDGVVFDEEEGRPMLYRIVGKREFGETQWPAKWIDAGRRQDRYTEELVWHEGLSDGKKEDGDWKPVPARAHGIKEGS